MNDEVCDKTHIPPATGAAQAGAAQASVAQVSVTQWQGLRTSQRIYLPFKRFFDIVFSLIALIVLSPLFLAVAIAVKADSKGPVIFKQQRAGKSGIPFTMYKFRSMSKDAEEELNLSEAIEDDSPFISKPKEDSRTTSIGFFLRKTSIDELPQLINILKNEMSIVGPRPLPMYEHEAMDAYMQQRTLVKPGLTCYWQVSGRSNLSKETRVELDLRYVKGFNVIIDIHLVLKTIPAVLSGEGAM